MTAPRFCGGGVEFSPDVPLDCAVSRSTPVHVCPCSSIPVRAFKIIAVYPTYPNVKSRARILVVDDEQLLRRMVRSVLAPKGYATEMAHDAEDALAKQSKSPFEIVITDIRMPGMADGFNLLKIIKSQWPDTAVIVMTGYGDVRTPDRARELGADEYITKPFNAREIEVIVERVCWRRMVSHRPPVATTADPQPVKAAFKRSVRSAPQQLQAV